MNEARPVTHCRGCGRDGLDQVLDLGALPACDHFPPLDDPSPDPVWPLALVLCRHCALLQLSHRSPAPEEPLAVESATLKRHATEVAQRLVERLGLEPGARVREFASHHGGSWQSALIEAGCVPVEAEAAVVIDNQSIIHAEELEPEMAERVAALSADGALVIEFHHALAQLTQGQFDTVRHGHPLYFSLHSWEAACRRHGLSVVDAWTEDVFGGCLVVVARRGDHPASPAVEAILAAENEARLTDARSYEALSESVAELTDRLRRHLESAAREGRRVAAYGAGSKACTLLGTAGLDSGLFERVADLAPGKHGRRVPGAGIPIVSPADLVASAPDEVLILTWDIADEVVAQLRAAGLGSARFFVPLPTWREVG